MSAPGPCSLDTRLGTEGTFGERRLQAPLQLEDRAQAIRAHQRQQMGPWSFFLLVLILKLPERPSRQAACSKTPVPGGALLGKGCLNTRLSTQLETLFVRKPPSHPAIVMPTLQAGSGMPTGTPAHLDHGVRLGQPL